MCKRGDPGAKKFFGKELYLGVAGLHVTSNVEKAKDLLRECEKVCVFCLVCSLVMDFIFDFLLVNCLIVVIAYLHGAYGMQSHWLFVG